MTERIRLNLQFAASCRKFRAYEEYLYHEQVSDNGRRDVFLESAVILLLSNMRSSLIADGRPDAV